MSNIYADITEILDIAQKGNSEIEEFREALDQLKTQIDLLEALKSPKYIEDMCESVNEFLDELDVELIENIASLYKAISDVADQIEEADVTIGGQVS